jgi:hypothetical protein
MNTDLILRLTQEATATALSNGSNREDAGLYDLAGIQVVEGGANSFCYDKVYEVIWYALSTVDKGVEEGYFEDGFDANAYKKDLIEIAEEMMRQSTAVKTKELAMFS